jgi:phosphate transport system permease protein
MAVLMATGQSVRLPGSPLDPIGTLTAVIAAELGEAVRGGDHYQALFSIGIVLFTLTLLVNVAATRLAARANAT